ncbi:hypothetical protein TRVA0_070S00452 [Trichomonascus vanleenenianus]|uniref:uncharacterized protein n=1 Tax=Trichomonascus vanleenenianus TaxID=2268995 RepID=UPI003ECA75EC
MPPSTTKPLKADSEDIVRRYCERLERTKAGRLLFDPSTELRQKIPIAYLPYFELQPQSILMDKILFVAVIREITTLVFFIVYNIFVLSPDHEKALPRITLDDLQECIDTIFEKAGWMFRGTSDKEKKDSVKYIFKDILAKLTMTDRMLQ